MRRSRPKIDSSGLRTVGARSERRRGEAAGDAQTVATISTRRSTPSAVAVMAMTAAKA